MQNSEESVFLWHRYPIGPAPLLDYQATLQSLADLLQISTQEYRTLPSISRPKRPTVDFSIFYVWEPRDPLTHPAPRSLRGR
jgi:hypothetical protein